MSDLGNKEVMALNIKHYLSLKGVSASEVCEAIGVPKATFSNWCTATTYPRIDKIEKMANYFGISKSDLVEMHTKGAILQDAIAAKPELRELFEALEGASPEEIARAIRIIEAIKQK